MVCDGPVRIPRRRSEGWIVRSQSQLQRAADIKTLPLNPIAIHSLNQPDECAVVTIRGAFENVRIDGARTLDGEKLAGDRARRRLAIQAGRLIPALAERSGVVADCVVTEEEKYAVVEDRTAYSSAKLVVAGVIT